MRAFRLLPVLTFAAVIAAQTPTPAAPAAPATPAAPAAAAQEKAPQKLDEKTYDHFGTGITVGDKAAALADVLKNPEQFVGKPVRIEGPITAICQTKGCWMHLGSQEPPVMVKFKDYAFFMPKDASGRTAIVEGTMAMKQETVEQTRHYLEDAGKHDEAKKVTEGRKLFHFMASGVAIQKRKLDEKAWDHFGTGITVGDKAAALADVLKNPEQFVGKPVRIEGPITAICQTKGCWMHLGSQEPPVMVKFKDYAFFMPKDASGRTAIVEGTMAMKQETVEQTRHYLEDAGKHDEAKKVTEGRKLFHFMASGVAIQKRKLDEKAWDHFGTGIVEGDKAAALADVLKNPEQFVGKPVRIEGPITAICQTKGCWMHLGSQEPPVMVKFKDYAFFMPKDASGRTAIVEGTMAMKQETVEQTRHYLEDAGKHDEAKKVTEGRKLFHFMASGVAIQKPAAK